MVDKIRSFQKPFGKWWKSQSFLGKLELRKINQGNWLGFPRIAVTRMV